METSDRARGIAAQAREATGRLADRAREQANRLVEDSKDEAVSGLDSLSNALRDSAGRLQREQSFFGGYAEGAAARVDRLARYLREGDPERFVRDAEDFARRRPEVFVGGLFVTGLLLARFLKSSGEAGPDEYAYSAGRSMGAGMAGGRRVDVDTPYTPESGSYGGSRTGTEPRNAWRNRPGRGPDIAPDDESELGV